ncbi:MAG: DUF2267 domain-containing protein [Xanthobacteraceae bacterium]
MSELIDRVVTQVGLDRAVAEKSVGIILDFLSKEGPADKVQSLLSRLPEHATLIAGAGDGGMLGGMGGIMGVGARLMGSGVDMNQIQSIIRVLMAYCNEKGAGGDLKEIAAAIPGLSQFI